LKWQWLDAVEEKVPRSMDIIMVVCKTVSRVVNELIGDEWPCAFISACAAKLISGGSFDTG
jgi:hypothetical protein